MTIHLRSDRVIFRFSGPEAHRLINDVVTGVMPTSSEEPASLWALLSPQGKILAEGLAAWAEDALWLDVHQSVADDFFKRMRMYRLRAKVEIDDLRETHRMGFATEPSATASSPRSKPRPTGPTTPPTTLPASPMASCTRATTSPPTTPLPMTLAWTSSKASTSSKAAMSARKSSPA
jgi:folate-binding Fe-S cluster repair protein YgfZ